MQSIMGTRQFYLYPRHTGGAVALRFLVKTAITAVTPPVVFHSFLLPVTPVYRSRTATGSPWVASLLFRDCTAALYPVTPEARCHYGF